MYKFVWRPKSLEIDFGLKLCVKISWQRFWRCPYRSSITHYGRQEITCHYNPYVFYEHCTQSSMIQQTNYGGKTLHHIFCHHTMQPSIPSLWNYHKMISIIRINSHDMDINIYTRSVTFNTISLGCTIDWMVNYIAQCNSFIYDWQLWARHTLSTESAQAGRRGPPSAILT